MFVLDMEEYLKVSTSPAMPLRIPCRGETDYVLTYPIRTAAYNTIFTFRQNGFSFTAWEDVINAMIEDGTFGMDEETIKMKKLGFVTALGVSGSVQHSTIVRFKTTP